MSTRLIVLLCVLGVLIAAAVVLYIFGKRTQRKQEKQKEEMERNSQTLTLYVIDKKKMKLKDAGLPKVVYDSAPRLSKLTKMPIIKAKAGNRVMSLVCDGEVYKSILPKQELKAQVAGIYIMSAKRVRGPQVEVKTKKKDKWLDKLR